MTPDGIPGWLSIAEADAVARASLQQHAFGVLFEVGTWCGRSPAMLAERLPDWKVMTFDAYADKPSDLDPEALAAEALARWPNVQRFTSWGGLLEGARFDVLLIDGAHTAEAVRRDLTLFALSLTRGGLLFVHRGDDTRRQMAIMDGVRQFLDANRKTNYIWAPAYEVGALKCYRRDR